MTLFGIGTKKRERVTERWIEMEIDRPGGLYLDDALVADLRAAVKHIDALGIPDDAHITLRYGEHIARWGKTVHRVAIEATE